MVLFTVLPQTVPPVPNLQGKVFLVTGATTGIGYETAKTLAANGGRVFIAGRSKERCQRAAESIEREASGPRFGKVDTLQCDLSSFRSIAQAAEDFKSRQVPLHVMINNAGIASPKGRAPKTPEGFDAQMGVNYFGPFYLTHLLMEVVARSTPRRLVFTGSATEGHGDLDEPDLTGASWQISDYREYSRSKLCDMMLATELSKRLGPAADVFIAHPGLCNTGLVEEQDKTKFGGLILTLGEAIFGQSPVRGANSLIKTATWESLTGQGGTHLHHGCWYYTLPYSWLGIFGAAVTNVRNLQANPPRNRLVRDFAACERLYRNSLDIVNATARRVGTPEVSPAQRMGVTPADGGHKTAGSRAPAGMASS